MTDTKTVLRGRTATPVVDSQYYLSLRADCNVSRLKDMNFASLTLSSLLLHSSTYVKIRSPVVHSETLPIPFI